MGIMFSGGLGTYLQTTKPAERLVSGAMLSPTSMVGAWGRLPCGTDVLVIPFARASEFTLALN